MVGLKDCGETSEETCLIFSQSNETGKPLTTPAGNVNRATLSWGGLATVEHPYKEALTQ